MPVSAVTKDEAGCAQGVKSEAKGFVSGAVMHGGAELRGAM